MLQLQFLKPKLKLKGVHPNSLQHKYRKIGIGTNFLPSYKLNMTLNLSIRMISLEERLTKSEVLTRKMLYISMFTGPRSSPNVELQLQQNSAV
jgi:hypothetical protein